MRDYSPVSCTTVGWEPGREDDRLDRAIIGGLMLEALLEAPPPAESQGRRHLLKTRIRESMATCLAGRVTLDRFRAMVHQLDRWFPLYYPLVFPAPPPPAPRRVEPHHLAPTAAGGVRGDLLAGWLRRHPEALPRRRHRKLDLRGLQDFLVLTRGVWFRLKDFEKYFAIDRKTAWEYLQKFRRQGLLCHNQGRSAAVRYALSEQFLAVQAQALRFRVAEVFPDLSEVLAAQVADRLIATGGEPFWAESWQEGLEPGRSPESISRLQDAGLLEVVGQSGPSLMLRLPRRWLQTGKEGS
jgi:hypothetical protein